MLLANSTVAKHLVDRDYPAIHRVHDKPDPLKIEAFKEFVAAFGFRFSKNDQISSRKMQEILASMSGKPEEKLITHVLLRSMKQARYSSESLGHFALAFSHYAHFTSPIRRYPDLIVHRALREIIQKKKKPGAWSVKAGEIAEHCSVTERTAEEAERDMVKLKQTQYMATRVGEEFDGIIAGVTNFGFFVELYEPAVDGLVRISTIHDDYYNYKEAEHALVGERTGKRFRLGDPARIKVTNVSVERRQIDFEWIDGNKSKDRSNLKRSTKKYGRKKPAHKVSVKRSGAKRRKRK
jgi:ribonuclease R